MASPQTSVVVTGIGLRTGLGAGREVTWRRLRAGQSAARWLAHDPISAEPPYAAFPLERNYSDDWPDPVISVCETLVDEALTDSELPVSRDDIARRLDIDRIGILVGLSKGGVRTLARAREAFCARARPEVDRNADWLNYGSPSSAAAWIAREKGFRGPCLAPIAACATGLVAVLQGADLIRRGACDVALCGAADTSLEPLILAAFRQMRVLARVVEEPIRAVRPWDTNRSGFLVGEGGAILVLERSDHALGRGVRPYAEVVGGALGSDAYHMTDLNPDPTDLAALIRRALRSCEIEPSETDYINVHGTATRVNDPLECQAIRGALGPWADHVSCSANKSQIGHLLGAAGAAELAITCLAIRDGFVPPTLNLDHPDPVCDLDATPHVGRERSIRVALKLSIGFGGHLAAALLRKPQGLKRTPVAERQSAMALP
jgi:3-oxoacyl-[acyl-carrier-protein] synthase II